MPYPFSHKGRTKDFQLFVIHLKGQIVRMHLKFLQGTLLQI